MADSEWSCPGDKNPPHEIMTFLRRGEAWDIIDLNSGEPLSGVGARRQVAGRGRDGAGAVNFELEPREIALFYFIRTGII